MTIVSVIRSPINIRVTLDKLTARLMTIYRCYNMDQVVGQALATFRRINEHLPEATANREPSTAAVPEAGT